MNEIHREPSNNVHKNGGRSLLGEHCYIYPENGTSTNVHNRRGRYYPLPPAQTQQRPRTSTERPRPRPNNVHVHSAIEAVDVRGRSGGRGHKTTTQRTHMIHARLTTYNGIRMRSRLEASFAAHLDNYSDPWVYEPRCFANAQGQYLPDFLVRDDGYVEVKPPNADLSAALNRMHIILSSEADAHLFVMTTQANGKFGLAGRCSPCPTCSTCRCDRTRDICRHHREEQTAPIREGAAAAARRQLAERNMTHSGRRCDGCDRPASQASPVEDFDLYLCNECSAKNTAAQERRRRIGEQYQCDRCPNSATNVIEDGDGDLALCDIHAWQASTDGTIDR